MRDALLRIFDMAEDRPDIREVARTALAARSEPGAEGLREAVIAFLAADDVTPEFCPEDMDTATWDALAKAYREKRAALDAARSETEPKPAPETTFDPVTGRYPPRESVTEMLAAMNDAETEPEGGTGR